jgi:hypothetical protein
MDASGHLTFELSGGPLAVRLSAGLGSAVARGAPGHLAMLSRGA